MNLRTKAFCALATVGLLLVGIPATAAPLPPQSDPFYQPPSGYESTAPGTVLRSREVSLASFAYLPQKVQSWQLLYRTTDRNGKPQATVTTVLLPQGAQASASRSLLSYQVAQDSTAPQCVPSYVLQPGSGNEGIATQAEILLIDAAVREGWAVSVPDYEGQDGHLGAAKEPGYAVLDGIRAAEHFSPLGLNGSKTKVGMWGYSGGGLATGWTVEMQPTYAPELNVAGAALGAPVPNLGALLDRLNGGLFSGLIPLGITALRKAYPQLADLLDQYLTPEGKAYFDNAATQCTAAVAAGGVLKDFNKYLTIPLKQLEQLPQTQEIFKDIRLGQYSPTAPLYVYQGVNDEVVNVADVDAQVAKYCAAGDSVTYKRDLLSEHVSLVITGAADALNWLKQRLGNGPVPRGCTTSTVLSTLLAPGALTTLGSVLFQDLLILFGRPVGPADMR